MNILSIDVRFGKVKTYGNRKFGFVLPDGVYNEKEKLHFQMEQGRDINPGYVHPLFQRYPIREPKPGDRIVFVQADPEDLFSPILIWGYEDQYKKVLEDILKMRFQIFRQYHFKKELARREAFPVSPAMNGRDLIDSLSCGRLHFCPIKNRDNCTTTEYVGLLTELSHEKVALIPKQFWTADQPISAVA